MKVNYEKAIGVNNDLKGNVEEQQDNIKHVKNNVIKMLKINFRKSQLLEHP